MGNQRVNFMTSHSLQLGTIVLRFIFYLTRIKKEQNVLQVISLLGIVNIFLLSI